MLIMFDIYQGTFKMYIDFVMQKWKICLINLYFVALFCLCYFCLCGANGNPLTHTTKRTFGSLERTQWKSVGARHSYRWF